MNAYEEYMKQIVAPMRQELVGHGFKELTTEDAVREHVQTAEGLSLVVINSVCGCAAGLARPAAIEAVETTTAKPDHLVTVFAGQDQEATETMRGYFEDVPPSSPSMAFWKDGKLAYFIPREQIENFPKEAIVDHIQGVLEQLQGQ
ncbi:BrxA/BrxB family bacilliredoxin [Chryseomicrobium aureum]|uniref:BrxA/BrxB family bacilliredoxin n=1 Tax=Chryseomicrobium aureum TaxID=1441723 RepID=UPI00370D3824